MYNNGTVVKDIVTKNILWYFVHFKQFNVKPFDILVKIDQIYEEIV